MMTHPATTMAQVLRLEYHDRIFIRVVLPVGAQARCVRQAVQHAQASSLLRCILLGNLSHKFSTIATRQWLLHYEPLHNILRLRPAATSHFACRPCWQPCALRPVPDQPVEMALMWQPEMFSY